MDYNAVLELLQNAIKDVNRQTIGYKVLRLERWLISNFSSLANLNEEKWKFIAQIFSDPSCWNGIKLEREVVGLKLIQEISEGGRNPLNIYDKYFFACKYCLVDQIPRLFRDVFQQFKEEMTFSVKHDDDYIRKELLRDFKRSNDVEYFWSNAVDKVSGEIMDCISIEKFREIVCINNETNWGEAIEYFYNKLQHDESIQDCLIDIALSISKKHRYTDIIEFCILKMNNEKKQKLLRKNYEENNSQILYALVEQYHLNLFRELLHHLDYNSFSYKEFGRLFSCLGKKLLLNPDLAIHTKETMMFFWRHEKLKEFKKEVFKDYEIKYGIAALIVDLRGNPDDEKKQQEILEILQHPDHEGVDAIQKQLLKTIVQLHGTDEEQHNKDAKLIEELFFKINKHRVSEAVKRPSNIYYRLPAHESFF